MADAQLTNHVNIKGFAVIEDLYAETEINAIIDTIYKVQPNADTFRKTADLFAIRQFLKGVPAVIPLIFNHCCPIKVTG